MNVFGGILESAHLSSLNVFVCPSVYEMFVSVKEVVGELTHYQTTNFRLSQTERVCR